VILERLVVGPLASNCYIVGSEMTKDGMIVDPGDEGERILEKVKDLQLDIKYILLTHGHFDHIGAVKDVSEATGAEICIHPDDVGYLQGKYESNFFTISYPAASSPKRLINDGDEIKIDDLTFLVLHTPGHTPGGICLLGQGVVFTGDTLFNHSIGRSDLPGGSSNQLINSLHAKLMILPDETMVYPGHGPETKIGMERRSNPFLRG